MWEHNEGSGIWSYVEDGNIVADVMVGEEGGLEANIYDEEGRLLDSRTYSFLSDAKTFVEKCCEVSPLEAEGESGMVSGRKNRILRARGDWDKADWRAGEKRNPQTKHFRNADKLLLKKIQQGNVDGEGAGDVIIGEASRY